MTVEEFFVEYLSSALDVPVSGDIPDPKPERFVTLELTGSRSENFLYHPIIAVQAWADNRADAGRLNEAVKTAMAKAVELPRISRCRLNGDYYFPELELKIPRYQSTYEVTYL